VYVRNLSEWDCYEGTFYAANAEAVWQNSIT